MKIQHAAASIRTKNGADRNAAARNAFEERNNETGYEDRSQV